MNVTESGFKNRQLHMEDYLQMVSAEQKEYAEVFDYSKITEKSGVITDYWTNNLLEVILRKKTLNKAYKQVKSNKGSGGIDGMQVDELLPYLRENQETLIQEIRDGKYKPNPVRRVEIPKETKGEFRKLGVPTVVDRMVQQAITQELTPIYEEQFSEYSFGFRPKRGAHDALRQCQKNVNDGYVYVVDMDLEKFFDTVCQSKLIEGGVISPVLANMFLHYVFDMWMKRNFPQAPFERYADDGVVHCKTKEEALFIKECLEKRFAECKLELHPTKTRIVYCKDKDRTRNEDLTEFDFLGYTFKAVYIMCKDGKMRSNFIASVSKTSAKTFRDKIKSLGIHKKTGCKIDMIAEILNPMLRGWINYFGKFNPSAMKFTLQCVERRLIKWAMCKYKNFRGHRQRAGKWLLSVRKREPKLFAHWSRLYPYC